MTVFILKQEYGEQYPKRELREFKSLGDLEMFFYGKFQKYVLYPEVQTMTGNFMKPSYFGEVFPVHVFTFRVTCQRIKFQMDMLVPSKEWAWAIFHEAYPMISPEEVEIY